MQKTRTRRQDVRVFCMITGGESPVDAGVVVPPARHARERLRHLDLAVTLDGLTSGWPDEHAG